MRMNKKENTDFDRMFRFLVVFAAMLFIIEVVTMVNSGIFDSIFKEKFDAEKHICEGYTYTTSVFDDDKKPMGVKCES